MDDEQSDPYVGLCLAGAIKTLKSINTPQYSIIYFRKQHCGYICRNVFIGRRLYTYDCIWIISTLYIHVRTNLMIQGLKCAAHHFKTQGPIKCVNFKENKTKPIISKELDLKIRLINNILLSKYNFIVYDLAPPKDRL